MVINKKRNISRDQSTHTTALSPPPPPPPKNKLLLQNRSQHFFSFSFVLNKNLVGNGINVEGMLIGFLQLRFKFGVRSKNGIRAPSFGNGLAGCP